MASRKKRLKEAKKLLEEKHGNSRLSREIARDNFQKAKKIFNACGERKLAAMAEKRQKDVEAAIFYSEAADAHTK